MIAFRKHPRSAYVRCKHCMRNDYHTILVTPKVRSILYALTAGLSRVFEPVRCEACGHVRMRGIWEAPKEAETGHAE